MLEGIIHWGVGIGSYVLPFLFVLSVLVFVHEFGHYWVARLNGVRVETFSIGFGPKLFGFNDKAGTHWKISLLPLGGYVKMFGDADAASRPGEQLARMSDSEKAVSFHHKRVGQRAAILAAGPGANYLFAILLITGLLSIYPHPMPPAVVGEVVPGSAAEKAEFMPGDKIIAVDAHAVSKFMDISHLVQSSEGKDLEITLERQGALITKTVTPMLNTVTGEDGKETRLPVLGLRAHAGPYPIYEAFYLSLKETGYITWTSLAGVAEMIAGKRDTKDLGGPIKIAELSGQAAHSGWPVLLWFMAFLSISLGLLNLFPIPVLDGGHLLFYCIEAIRGRPITPKVQEYGFRVGFALVLSLLIFALWNDVSHSAFTLSTGG